MQGVTQQGHRAADNDDRSLEEGGGRQGGHGELQRPHALPAGFQGAIDRGGAWNEAVVPSLYRDAPPDEAAVKEGSALLRGWWERIEQISDADLVKGQIQ